MPLLDKKRKSIRMRESRGAVRSRQSVEHRFAENESRRASRGRPLIVLGAGADVAFDLPTIPKLARALDDFCLGDGKRVNQTLRKKLRHVRLSFGKVGAEAGERLVARLFEQPHDLSQTLKSIRLKLDKIEGGAPVAEILGKLTEMAERNEVRPELVERLPGSTQERGSEGASGRVLDPDRLALTPEVRTAIRITFQSVLPQAALTDAERKLADDIIAAISSVEDLLSDHFARFSERTALAEKRTFLYLAWILWSFLRIRSSSADRRRPSIYGALDGLGVDIVTFNYTNFFPTSVAADVRYFHGSLDQYLRADSRDVVTDDQELTAAVDVDSVVQFLSKLRLDVSKEGNALDLPAIVPPLTFKPVMSRAQLRTWSEVDSLMESAPAVAIIGYSFDQVDEHFNDLLRRGNPEARIYVIGPHTDTTWRRAARVLKMDAARPKASRRDGRDVLRAGRLVCIGGRAEEFDRRTLRELLLK